MGSIQRALFGTCKRIARAPDLYCNMSNKIHKDIKDVKRKRDEKTSIELYLSSLFCNLSNTFAEQRRVDGQLSKSCK